jgi:hypothetical protein
MTILSRVLVALGLYCLVLTAPAAEAAEESAKKKWTILVFLNADSNLEHFGFKDMQEMERAGSSDEVNLVVQFDQLEKRGTQRYLIEKASRSHKTSQEIQSRIVEDRPEVDMGDWRELRDFLIWGIKNYPAENYALILWNHGSGWSKEEEQEALKGISYDDTSGNHIKTEQLPQVFTEVQLETDQRMAIIAFDACVMAMVEVAHVLAPHADYMVASEEDVPGPGYPYDGWLKAWFSDGLLSSESFIESLVNEFGKSYSGGSQGSRSVTISAFDLKETDRLAQKVNAWVDSLHERSGLASEQILSAASQSLGFGYSGWRSQEIRDLGHYVELNYNEYMKQQMDSSLRALNFKSASIALLDQIDRFVVKKFNSASYAKARGVSIHLPYDESGKSSWSSNFSWDLATKARYRALTWSTATKWHEHLDFLFPGL